MNWIALRLRRAATLAGLCGILGLSGAAGAATVLVKAGDGTPDAGGCGSKGNPCDTIQAGVDNAAPGDVVKIAKGDYEEAVTVSTPGITLRGAGTLRRSPGGSCFGDASRTFFAGGPGTGACRDLPDQASCEAAWHIGGDRDDTPYSCFWDDVEGCRGCGPTNQDDELCTNSCGPIIPGALVIGASDVTVEKLRIRVPPLRGVVVLPEAQNASLEKLRIEGAGLDCIAGYGDGLTVEGSILRACGLDCIEAGGAGSRLEKNKLVGCAATGIDSRGSQRQIARNTVRLATEGIRFAGNDVTVERNRVSLCDGTAIEGFGRDVSLLRNRTSSSFEGIFYECDSCTDPARTFFAGGPDTEACRSLTDQASCEAAWHLGGSGVASCFWDDVEGCRGCGPNHEENENCENTCDDGAGACSGLVSRNRVAEILGDCIDVVAADEGLVVERNRIAGCEDEGLELEGVGIVASRNTIAECGNDFGDHGVLVHDESLDVVVEDSSVQGCFGDGFHVEPGAENTRLARNLARDNGEDGFDVDGAFGTTIERATARNNVDGGIEVGEFSENTSVTGSRASGNLVDFCDQGTGTTQSGNQFGTTAPVCPPDPDDAVGIF